MKAGRAKPVWSGHPWIHADSVAHLDDGPPEDDWVRVVDADRRFVARGLLSADSAIRVRVVTRDDAEDDPLPLLLAQLDRAIDLRTRLFPDPEVTDAYRLVHAEGDGLPGLVVDRLGPVLVAQFAIHGMHQRRAALAAHLLARTGAASLVTRAGGFEDIEGIADDQALHLGAPVPDSVEIREEGLRLVAAPWRGQKTGHYVDQRENRRLVGSLARGLEVLDLYAGTGGFSLQCLRHGAAHALAVEASERSTDAAVVNAQRNGMERRLEVRTADVTPLLTALRAEKRQFDLVIADPPNFFPRRGGDGVALKAHRELNVRAMARVRPGGFLATFTCSARLQPAAFLDLLRSAGRECRRDFRVLRELGAGPDHPVSGGLPEGRYLAGILIQVDSETHARPGPASKG